MGLIGQKTAAGIWECYREIEMSEKLLVDLEQACLDHYHDPSRQLLLLKQFYRRKNLQPIIISGDSHSSPYVTSPAQAKPLIMRHISFQKAALQELNEQARIELSQPTTQEE